MKAQVLHGIGDLRYENIEKPQLKEDWVMVKVMAAGVCGSDIPRIYKTGAHVHPIVLGHEFSGRVVETFDKNSRWNGKRVGGRNMQIRMRTKFIKSLIKYIKI